MENKKNYLKILKVKATGNRVDVDFECKGLIGKFFRSKKFFAVYSGVNIEHVPEHILIIPFLSTVYSLAWANRADIYTPVIDQTFLAALKKNKAVFQKYYPTIPFRGNIISEKTVNTQSQEGKTKRAMMLFSGGIDSMSTFVSHYKEKPIVVSVFGADITLDKQEEWTAKTKDFKKFTAKNKAEFRVIQSNFYDMLNKIMLKVFFERLNGDWYDQVMVGPALLGLCAPLTHIFDVDRLYIASGYDTKYHVPCGTTPETDGNMAWNNTVCIHDGYELSRFQKLQNIAEYAKKTGFDLPIKACISGKGVNCSVNCLKCAMAVIGLELLGLDPNRHGLKVDEETFKKIRANLENRWIFTDLRRYWWGELQSYAKTVKALPHPQAKEFFDWFLKINIKSVGLRRDKKNIFWRLTAPQLRFLPYPICRVYGEIYTGYVHRSIFFKRIMPK